MPVRQEDTEELSALVEQPPPEAPEARDWAFGVPESAPEHSSRESLIDPDANWRHQAGQRAPAEIPLPQSARERFSENWERLASSPQGETRSRSRMRRKLESSKVSGWMFSGGRFELNAVAGTLMLLILLVSAFVYGRRLLTPSEPKADPPAKTNGN
jgi:hypothetical protein